jgi:tRNA threonylcarbamoyladenosine modification (KEOPS) complex  Pcc1 subunit
MNAKATIRFPLKSERQLTALIEAIKPEVNKQIGTRSLTTITRDKLFLVLNVEADDTVALRSALNAYLRWINSTLNVIEIVNKES